MERCRVAAARTGSTFLNLNLKVLLIGVCHNFTLMYCPINTMDTIVTMTAMVFMFIGCMEQCRVGHEQKVCMFVLLCVFTFEGHIGVQ